MSKQTQHIFWDEASHCILRDDGSVYDFNEYPDRPHLCGSFSEALERVKSWRDSVTEYQLHVTNTKNL